MRPNQLTPTSPSASSSSGSTPSPPSSPTAPLHPTAHRTPHRTLSTLSLPTTTPDHPKIHHLPPHHPIWACASCLTPLALQDELVSKAFSGRNGRAYLMHGVVNTKIGKVEERRLLTGLHTVADLLCLQCSTSLGWVYLKANERDQEYKEGKYILEASRIIKENNWEL